MTLGERLRDLRINARLSLEEVAERLGVHFTTLGGYERDERRPSIKRLKALADFYSVSLDYLITGKIDRTADSAQFNIYQAPLPPGLTADSPQEEWEAVLADAITRAGIDLTVEDRQQIVEAAAAVVSTLAKQKAAPKKRGQDKKQPPKK